MAVGGGGGGGGGARGTAHAHANAGAGGVTHSAPQARGVVHCRRPVQITRHTCTRFVWYHIYWDHPIPLRPRPPTCTAFYLRVGCHTPPRVASKALFSQGWRATRTPEPVTWSLLLPPTAAAACSRAQLPVRHAPDARSPPPSWAAAAAVVVVAVTALSWVAMAPGT